MLFGIHFSEAEGRAIGARLAADPDWARLRGIVSRFLVGETPFHSTRPGAPRPNASLAGGLGHAASALSAIYAIEPTEPVRAVLTDFLRWAGVQDSLVLGAAFIQGQFLKGVVLALDAVGETLTQAERIAVSERIALGAIDNPDPIAAANNNPDGCPPMRKLLEIPGIGFHIKDEQVNNWDMLSSMGMIYASRAVEALSPARADEVKNWIALARRRLERFYALQYTEQGEYGEGPGYFSYGSTGTVLTLDMLARWQNGQWQQALATKGVMAWGRWAREMQPREVEHGPFNVNDCYLGFLESPAILHWIAARTQDAQVQHFGDELRRLAFQRAEAASGSVQELEGLVYSLAWRDNSLKPIAPAGKRTTLFGKFGTLISRTGYTSDDLCFFFRCGAPAGAHTHADRGTFLLTAFGENMVSEGGRPMDRAAVKEFMTFHHEVWAHNCAMPAGMTQKREVEGKYVQGRITSFEAIEDGVSIQADLSAVYPGAGRVERRVRFSNNGWLLIEDFIENPGEAMEFRLHTDNRDRNARIQIELGRATILRPRASLIVFPLLGAGIQDAGANFQDADREGLRTLLLRHASSGMAPATLLVAVRAGEEDRVTLAPDGSGAWRLSTPTRSERIALSN